MADLSKKISITVEGDAEVILNNIKNALTETDIAVKKLAETQNTAAQSSKESAGAFSSVANALKTLTGAGIIIEIFSKLKEMLMGNAVVAKQVETAMNFLKVVMNEIVDVVVKVAEKVGSMWEKMDATKKVVGDLMTIFKGEFKLIFSDIALLLNVIQLAWEKSFFGKGDVSKIKELEGNISCFKTTIKSTAEEMLSSGVDLAKNVVKAAGEIINTTIEAGKVAGEELKKIDLGADLRRAASLQEAKEGLKVKLIYLEEELNALKELQQQDMNARNDKTKSFEERRMYSDKVLKDLEDEKNKNLEITKVHLEQAQNAYALEHSEENHTKIIAAQAEGQAVLAEYERAKTRQSKQNIALKIEEASLDIKINNEEWDAIKKKMDADAKLIKNVDDRIAKQKENLKVQLEGDRMRLDAESKNDSLTEDQRRTAKQKLKDIELKYNSDLAALNDEAAKHSTKSALDAQNRIVDDETQTLKKRIAANKAAQLILSKDTAMGEDERTKAVADAAKKQRELKLAAIDNDQKNAQLAVSALQGIDQAATNTSIALLNQKLKDGKISQEQYDKDVKKIKEEAAKREKAYAITSAIINTAASIVKTGAEMGYPAAIPFQIAAGILGAAQIAKILSTPVGETAGSSTTVPSVSTSASSAPNTSFSFSPTSTNNTTTPVLKTYILSSDVATQTQLDRAIISNGTI